MYLAPEANFRLNKLLSEVVVSQNMADIKPRVFYQDLPYYSLYFRDISPGRTTGRMFFSTPRDPPDEDTLLLAKKGRFVSEPNEKRGERGSFQRSDSQFQEEGTRKLLADPVYPENGKN